MADIKKIDKNFVNVETTNELDYYDPTLCDNIKVYGLNWFDEDKRYIRFPKSSDEMIKNLAEGLNSLVEQTSGVMLAFYSDCTTLKIKVELGTIFNMGHMAFTGQGGCDVYVSHSGKFEDLIFFRTAAYNIYKKEYEFTYFSDFEKKDRLYVINLPLYSGVKKIEVGVNKTAYVKAANDIFTNGRIVVYGTSITQGGCASRPGVNYTNALSRRMNYEFMNYGFSGNGRGQKEVVDLVTSVDNVKMFILDYEANATLPMLQATLDNFINTIREKYPEVPILVVSKIRMSIETHVKANRDRQRKSLNFQKNVVKEHSKNDKNIYFYDGHNFFGKYTTEATVDGCHPTDLGFMLMTEKFEKIIKKILNK